MTRPFVAFLLNFLLPGTGLIYLGRWKWAIINLAVVICVGILAAFLLPNAIFDKYIRLIAIGCAGGSAGLARQLAVQMNQKTKRSAL